MGPGGWTSASAGPAATPRRCRPRSCGAPRGGTLPPVGAPRPSPVEIAGRVDDARLAQLYREAPCVVAPAYEEDYGLTAVEAMRYGTPVIVCRDGGGLAGIVRDGFDGLVVDPDGPSIAAAVHRICSDDDLRETLSRGARGHRGHASPAAGRRPARRRPRGRSGIAVKIGIVAPSPVPFTRGGAERAWSGLARGHRRADAPRGRAREAAGRASTTCPS